MPVYRPEDINQQTLLLKGGDSSIRIACPTLQEAVLEVIRWPKSEQGNARFKMTGKGYEYTWADLKPHVE
jgi:hypothetical protein